MPYYYTDLFKGCVIAELTDAEQAQNLIQRLGPVYGVIETGTTLAAKPLPAPSGPEPRGVVSGYPIYGSLDHAGITYTPLVVADVFTDHDLTPEQVHHDSSRFTLTTDGDGFVRGATPSFG